jgi:NAD(P)-dependent dehydrogenase (short-subunit alcohol dehydrogenase family)
VSAPDISQLFDMTGRVAIVTGGSRGLGLAIARGFAAAGAKVVLASRKLDSCEEAAAIVRSEGGDALAVACHMGELDQVTALVARAADHYGRIDCVVNNAASPLRFTVRAAEEAAWDKSMDVNLKGPVFLMQAALPHLSRSDCATIINVLSVGGLRGSLSRLGYGSAKAALLHATRSAAKELAPLGIRVNALAPGPFATRMLTTGSPELQDSAAAGTLLRRVADPEEIIGAALFLATRASSFVTGAVMVIDGGMLA